MTKILKREFSLKKYPVMASTENPHGARILASIKIIISVQTKTTRRVTVAHLWRIAQERRYVHMIGLMLQIYFYIIFVLMITHVVIKSLRWAMMKFIVKPLMETSMCLLEMMFVPT